MIHASSRRFGFIISLTALGIAAWLLALTAFGATTPPYETKTFSRASKLFSVPERWLKEWFGDMPEIIEAYPEQVKKSFRIALPAFDAKALPRANRINATLVEKVFETGSFFYPEPVQPEKPFDALDKTLDAEILHYEGSLKKGENYFGEAHQLKGAVRYFRPPVASFVYTYNSRTTGNAVGKTKKTFFSVDTDTGAPILFDQLFDPAATNKLIELARRQAKRDPKLKPFLERISADTFSPNEPDDINERFLLDEKGLALLLRKGRQYGELTLPYAALKPLMKKDALRYLPDAR